MGLFDFMKRPDMGQELERFARTPGALLLDVRTEEEYAGGHIPGSRNVPLGTLGRAELPADPETPLFVYCLSGARAARRPPSCGVPGTPMSQTWVGSAIIAERWFNEMKVVIVGGVAGGATAAARLRRLDESAEIVVFERSGYVSYANCGLPYYIGGVITDKAELTLQTPESFWRRFRVDMRVRHEVTAIHPDAKTVDVKNLATGETFAEPYDKLILSPGARPTQPPLPGVGIGRLFTLRTVEDTLKLREFIEQNHPKSAVLAGGGFIGIELVENLRELGLDVTVVQRPKQLLNPLDADMAAFLHAQLRQKGVRLHLGRTVEGFAADGGPGERAYP